MTFCPLCETVHGTDEPCSIRGLTAVKSKPKKQDPVAQTEERSHPKRQAEGSSPSGVAKSGRGETVNAAALNSADIAGSSPAARTKARKPSKDELRAIIAQLESEKAERRKRKAATQKRWRYKKAGKE